MNNSLSFFSNKIRHSSELILISLVILSYLNRTALPSLKYPFLVFYSILLVYCVVLHTRRLIKSLKILLLDYGLILLLFGVLFIAFIVTNKIYLVVFKDLINVVILISFLVPLNILIINKDDLKLFIKYFINTIIFFSLIIAFSGIINLLGIISTKSIIYSENPDYNIALIPVFFGMISLFIFSIKNDYPFLLRLLNTSIFSIFSLYIFFKGSRRGIILLTIIILILIILSFIKNRKIQGLKKIVDTSKLSLIMLFFFFSIISIFTLKLSCNSKNKVLELIGTKYITVTKRNIEVHLSRYVSIANSKLSTGKAYNKYFVNDEYNPKDPDCGWGFNFGKRTYPLIGLNKNGIPEDAIGCLVDSTSFIPRSNCAVAAEVNTLNAKSNERYVASVYCYVSNDFNGHFVRFNVDWNAVRKSIVSNQTEVYPETYYDLQKKGTWQKLEIKIIFNKEGKVPIYCSVTKKEKNGHSALNGYVIIAFPNIDTLNSWNNNSLEAYKRLGINNSKIFSSDTINVDRKGLFINKLMSTQRASIMPFLSINVDHIINRDKDPIRNFTAKFISEDTTYYAYRNELFIDTLNNKFMGARINRWRFAGQIFLKEYNWKEKVLGKGFDFLNWYGYYFDHDKSKTDYPHNPFLHILLYSGILGLCFYIFLLYKAFYYYIKYIKEYYLFFIFFLITFFFTFFSGGNPFDPPIMGFFVILPFFIHSINKRESNEKFNKKK